MKFKNIKKKDHKDDKKRSQKSKVIFTKPKNPTVNSGQKREFPRIYRFITESHLVRLRWKKRQFWLSVISMLAFIGFAVVCVHVYGYYQLSKSVQKERGVYKERLAQWEKINMEFPGFRDGYLQAAMYAYQLGDTTKAKEYTQDALNIDPNFLPSKRMSSYLGMSEKEKIEN